MEGAKGSVTADLPAHATPITDPDTRHTVLTRIRQAIGRTDDEAAWLARSPLVAVTFDG